MALTHVRDLGFRVDIRDLSGLVVRDLGFSYLGFRGSGFRDLGFGI